MNVQAQPFPKLRGFLQSDRGPASREEPPENLCELCSIPLRSEHRHLLEMPSRDVVCACDPCGLRFQDVTGGRFKLIPRDALSLTDFKMSQAQWDALSVPINLLFIFDDSAAGKWNALYPSPAGVTESSLALAAWEALAAENEILNDMQADVEALLINRLGNAPSYYLCPIDDCYELAGLVRLHWRGLAGGQEVWNEVEQFFSRLRKDARHA